MMCLYKNSLLNKTWLKIYKEKNIIFHEKPFLPNYFHAYGKMRFNIFKCEDKIYCMFESDHSFHSPENFIEIKASEYHKIIEESEGKYNFS